MLQIKQGQVHLTKGNKMLVKFLLHQKMSGKIFPENKFFQIYATEKIFPEIIMYYQTWLGK
jgi:predicted Ser/Thr protein kinase